MFQQFIIGDSYSFTTTVADYLATDGWALAHLLRPRSSGDLITILADPTEGDAVDTRSHARKALTAIEAMIEGRATQMQERYTIEGREVWMIPIPELLKFRAYYRAEVAAEDARARVAAGLPDPRKKYVRFNRV